MSQVKHRYVCGLKFSLHIHSLIRVFNCCGFLITLPASSEFCGLLATFANSLDPDLSRHSVRPDLDPSCLTLLLFLNEYFEKVMLKKS